MNGEYKVIANLSPGQWAYIVDTIQHLEIYDINDMSHIIVRNSDIEVGFLGDDTFELVEPNNP